MNQITRNNIFMENENLIKRTMRRNRLLLRALRLEEDDVYQELALAALRAIESFDPLRCDNIRIHIWAQLQYAVLDIKRRHKPHGLSAYDCFGPGVFSLDLSDESNHLVQTDPYLDAYEEDPVRERRLRQALSRLEPQEREVVILYLGGMEPTRKAQKDDFTAAIEKLRAFYLAAQFAAGAL